jgi:uncharacterized CHY-type Zn-finger protein
MSTEEQRAAWRENYRYYHERAKRLHRCYICGKDAEPNPSGGYYSRCADCMAKARAYEHEKRVKRIAEHKCAACGVLVAKINPKTGRNCRLCPACQKRHNESNQKWVEREAQK